MCLIFVIWKSCRKARIKNKTRNSGMVRHIIIRVLGYDNVWISISDNVNNLIINENLTIEKICSTLHYNRSYIFKQFKKNTGSSIIAYFNKMKIEKAKQLLRETDMSVTAISEYLTFESPNYFSKLFKKTTGHTPSTYRKIRKR